MSSLRSSTIASDSKQGEPYYPVISIGQALLVLVEKYKNKPVICDQLKSLYFLGAQNEADKKDIEKWLSDPAIVQHYIVSLPPKKPVEQESDSTASTGTLAEYKANLESHYNIINNDPSRRYFETHLAYQTLLSNPMKDLDIGELEKHCAHLESMLPTTESLKGLYSAEEQKTLPPTVLDILNNIIKGDFRHVRDKVTTDKFSASEYSDAIKKLESKDHYTDFSPEDKKKMALLVRCSFLCVTIVRHIPTLPLSRPVDVYTTGFYAPDSRGAVKKESYDDMKSSNLGLMLSYMWLPEGDKAKSDSVIPYPRVADRNTIKKDAGWVEDNFGYLVHPFSCSISGTMLIHHKVFKQLQLDEKFIYGDPEKYIQYIKSFVPLMLFNSGGHSFHEFLYPLRLPTVREAFSFIKGFNDVNNKTLFMDGNKEAFDKAFDEATEYNKLLLARKSLHKQIQSRSGDELKVSEKSKPHPAAPVETPTVSVQLEKQKAQDSTASAGASASVSVKLEEQKPQSKQTEQSDDKSKEKLPFFDKAKSRTEKLVGQLDKPNIRAKL